MASNEAMEEQKEFTAAHYVVFLLVVAIAIAAILKAFFPTVIPILASVPWFAIASALLIGLLIVGLIVTRRLEPGKADE